MADALLRLDDAGASADCQSAQFRRPTAPQLWLLRAALAPIADLPCCLPCCLLIVDPAAVALLGGCVVILAMSGVALDHRVRLLPGSPYHVLREVTSDRRASSSSFSSAAAARCSALASLYP